MSPLSKAFVEPRVGAPVLSYRQLLVSGPLLAHDEENVAVADSVSARKELSILT